MSLPGKYWGPTRELQMAAAKDEVEALAEPNSLPPENPVSTTRSGVKETRSETDRRSFVDAAWDKYHGDMAMDDCIGIYVPKKGPAKITDSGHLILPWRVHLTHCGITEAGQYDSMSSMCRNVTELDLAQNSITSLEEVVQVISCMPQLNFLNLTNNPLHSSSISLAAHSVSSPLHIPPSPSHTAPVSIANIMGGSTASTPSDDASLSDPSAGGTDEDLSPGFSAFQGEMEMDTTPPDPRTENINDTNANVESTTTTTTTAIAETTTSTTNTTTTIAETTSTTTISTTISTTTHPSAGDIASSSPGTNSLVGEECAAASFPSDCPMEAVGQPLPSPPVAAFSTLRQLVLNDTGVEWRGIVGLLRLFPGLEELHLSLNHYRQVDIPDDFLYPSLCRLFFNNNDVTSWAQVCRLGRLFPALKHLFLAETRLICLEVEEGARSMEELFPSLVLLSLNKTQLGGWEEVDRLRHFPSLTDVRLQGIPFLEEQQEELRRQQLVARLPNISRLNGSSIMAEERLDAERAFIRLFQDLETKPDRYYELVEVYGQLDPLVKVNLTPQTVFRVGIVMGDRREPYEVNVQQTVRELKKSLQDMAGLPSAKFHLFYLDKQCAYGADKLKYLDKKLYTYNIADGDDFIIQPKE